MTMKISELKNKKIIIATFGYYGCVLFERLKLNGINAIAFFDKNVNLQHSKYKNAHIYPWTYFHDTYVIINSEKYEDEFKEILKDIGYQDEFIIRASEVEFDYSFNKALLNVDREEYECLQGRVQELAIEQKKAMLTEQIKKDSVVLEVLPVIVTTRCTLNCEYCFAKIPYFSKREDIDIDYIIKQLDKILSVVDYVKHIEIYGGEPLLHKDLWKLIEYINSPKVQEKVAYTYILTNGTLMLDEKVIEKILENKNYWIIRYSPYGKYSKKQFELFEQCNENKLFYRTAYMPYWHKFGIISEPDNPKDYSIDKCKSCCCYTPTFFDGKVYSCATLAFAGYLKMYPEDRRNYLDIFSDEFTKDNFREFMQTAQPAMAWCNSNHKTLRTDDEFTGEKIPVAEQAKGILPYKRYE